MGRVDSAREEVGPGSGGNDDVEMGVCCYKVGENKERN